MVVYEHTRSRDGISGGIQRMYFYSPLLDSMISGEVCTDHPTTQVSAIRYGPT